MNLPAKYNGHGIIEHTLPEHKSIKINVHVQIVEYRNDRERIGRRYQGAEVQGVEEREGRRELRYHLHEGVHERPENNVAHNIVT